MDILGLIFALFPTVNLKPWIILGINLAVILSTSIYILIKKDYRKLTKPKAILLEHTYHINALAISANGKFLASCGGDNFAILWNIKTNKPLERIQHESWVGNIAFSPDNKFLYTLTGKNGTINQWDLEEKKLIFSKSWHKDQTRGLAISKSGKRAAISCKDGTFSYFDPTEKDFYSMPFKITEVELRKICISKSDIIATANTKGELFLIDFNNSESNSCKLIYQDDNNEMIRGLSFNSKGTTLAFTDSGGNLKIMNLQSDKIFSVKAHNGHAIAVTFSPNDQFVATGGQDNIICIWELKNDRIIKSFEIHGHSDDVTSLVFDNNLGLYSASRDSTIKIWGLAGIY
jgi:WD40 repeat protein